MYIAIVVLLTIVLPLALAIVDRFVMHAPSGFLVLLAFWMAFWAGGVRLLMAGLRQTLRPELTTQQIFGIKGQEVLPVMREVGFANLAMGTLGVLSVLDRSLLVPAAAAKDVTQAAQDLGVAVADAGEARDAARAGADGILTYFAVDAAKWLKE